jgi:quinol monooxygenase YgiN
MLTNLAFFRAKPGQTKSLGNALTDLVDATRQEAGCISYDLHKSLEDPDSWFVYENWRSSADLDAHMQTAHIKAFLELAASLVQGDIGAQRFTMTSSLSAKFGTSFSGKNIIITGASGDLGLAIVRRLVSEGANVLAVAGSARKLPALKTISGTGVLETLIADVSDTKQVLAYATPGIRALGRDRRFRKQRRHPSCRAADRRFSRRGLRPCDGCLRSRHVSGTQVRASENARRWVGRKYDQRFGAGGEALASTLMSHPNTPSSVSRKPQHSSRGRAASGLTHAPRGRSLGE